MKGSMLAMNAFLPCLQQVKTSVQQAALGEAAGVLNTRLGAFVATFQGDIAALDTRSGRFIWKEKTSTANDLLSSRGKVILIDEKDQVIAYSQNNGDLEWLNKDFYLRELTSPKKIKSLIVYGDFQGYLHVLDTNQGEQVARQRISRSKIISVSVEEETVLALDSKGKLSLFTLQ